MNLYGPWIAYFSKYQADRFGTVIYARSDGSEVECTEVSSIDNSKFEPVYDAVNLGIVTKFVRRVEQCNLHGKYY
jgi:hypothetical protein